MKKSQGLGLKVKYSAKIFQTALLNFDGMLSILMLRGMRRLNRVNTVVQRKVKFGPMFGRSSFFFYESEATAEFPKGFLPSG